METTTKREERARERAKDRTRREAERKRRRGYALKVAIISGVVVLLFGVALVAYPWCAIQGTESRPWDDRGAFGDMFGGAAALFSGAALAGVVVAIILQGDELALQRDELAETREVLDVQVDELARSAEAQAKSEEALRLQITQLALSAEVAAISTMIRHCQDAIDAMPQGADVFGLGRQLAAKRTFYLEWLDKRLEKLNPDWAGVPLGLRMSPVVRQPRRRPPLA